MEKQGMGFFWVASVWSIIGVVVYGAACSNDVEDPAKNFTGVHGTCKADDNPCTVEDCSNGSVQTTTLADDIVVEFGPPPLCRKWVCKNGKPEPKPLLAGADCAPPVGNPGHCNDVQECVECTVNAHCTTGKPVCHENKCAVCVVGGIQCENSQCEKCNGESCNNRPGECASGNCVDGRCCNQSCPGPCASCTTGMCTPLDFMSQPPGCSQWPKACDGMGQCKIASGSGCSTNADCLSGLCRGLCAQNTFCYDGNPCGGNTCTGRICLQDEGMPCSHPSHCDSNNCVPANAGANAGTCQP